MGRLDTDSAKMDGRLSSYIIIIFFILTLFPVLYPYDTIYQSIQPNSIKNRASIILFIVIKKNWYIESNPFISAQRVISDLYVKSKFYKGIAHTIDNGNSEGNKKVVAVDRRGRSKNMLYKIESIEQKNISWNIHHSSNSHENKENL